MAWVPLATVILILILCLVPMSYYCMVPRLLESTCRLGLATFTLALPSSGQSVDVLVVIKTWIVDPLVYFLLGWELNDSKSTFGASNGFLSAPEYHRNSMPDRSTITSRAQLQQFRHSDATQGMAAVLDKPTAAPPRPYVRGLVNTGNSCFLNSVLQAFSGLSMLTPYLESMISRSNDLNMYDDDLVVTAALLDTVKALQQPIAKHESFRPNDIVLALEEAHSRDTTTGYRSTIMNREQQDAQELFQMISSTLTTEASMVLKVQSTRSVFDFGFIKQLLGISPAPHDHQTDEMQVNPMTGMLASRLSCTQCGYTEAVRHFTFDSLSLSLPPRHSCSIEDCLRQYTNLESLQDVVCRKCSLMATLDRIEEQIEVLDYPQRAHQDVSYGKQDLVEADSDDNDEPYRTGLTTPHRRLHTVTSSKASKKNKSRRRAKKNATDPARQERMALKAKLMQQKEALESVIRFDVEKPLPDIKLTNVVSPHCTKQVMVARPPQVLCLHFIRSQYSNYGTVSKNTCYVRLPEYLDMAPFSTNGFLSTQPTSPLSVSEKDLENLRADPSRLSMDNNQATQQQQMVVYRLQSIVVHFGGHSYGHFIAYRRKPRETQPNGGPTLCNDGYGGYGGADEWFRISDDAVESVSLDHVLRSNPYMCLYERIELGGKKEAGNIKPPTSRFSLHSVELGLVKLKKRLDMSKNMKEKLQDRRQEKIKVEAGEDDENHRDQHAEIQSNPDHIDFAFLTKDNYNQLFNEKLKAVSAQSRSRLRTLHDDEDMSDTESIHDMDRSWRSFVSSPNSTTPPSPSAGSSGSSTVSSQQTSPIILQRSKATRV